MYEEFCIPYNEKIAKEFRGFTLLICGDLENKILKFILKTIGLRGIIYWSKDIKKLLESYKLARKKKISIIWYNNISKTKKDYFSTGIILKNK